jgi:hypothetical protein
MPRQLPNFAYRFSQQVTKSLSIAEAGELIRSASPPLSVAKRQMGIYRLEALYEMAFLRVFIDWETFLEETFLRYMCGYVTSIGPPPLIGSRSQTISNARVQMLGTSNFVSWASVSAIENRCQRFFNNCLHEQVVSSNRSRLGWFASVRHRIAHASDFARAKFDVATMSLAGRRYRGSSPGRFLRDHDQSVSPAARYIKTIGRELINLSVQIAP